MSAEAIALLDLIGQTRSLQQWSQQVIDDAPVLEGLGDGHIREFHPALKVAGHVVTLIDGFRKDFSQ